MNYATKHITSTLKAAREGKGLSQRELTQKAGVPQGHISKIENNSVDLRVSSLIALARALDLELVLIPRKASSAVQSIVRRIEPAARKAKAARLAAKELKKLQACLASLSKVVVGPREVAQLQQQARDLQHFDLSRSDLDVVRKARQEATAFMKDTGNLDTIRRSLSHIQRLRNELAHRVAQVSTPESVRPAYSLDEEDDHG